MSFTIFMTFKLTDVDHVVRKLSDQRCLAGEEVHPIQPGDAADDERCVGGVSDRHARELS